MSSQKDYLYWEFHHLLHKLRTLMDQSPFELKNAAKHILLHVIARSIRQQFPTRYSQTKLYIQRIFYSFSHTVQKQRCKQHLLATVEYRFWQCFQIFFIVYVHDCFSPLFNLAIAYIENDLTHIFILVCSYTVTI